MENQVKKQEHFSTAAVLNADPNIINLKQGIAEAVNEAKAVTVLLSDDVDKAGHYLKNLNKLTKVIEDVRKRMTVPLDEQKKEIMSFFKNLAIPVEAELSRLDSETKQWLKAQKEEQARREAEERRLAEEKAMQEAIEKEARLKAEAQAKGEDPAQIQVEVPIIAEEIPQQVKLSNFTSSGVTTMQVPKWRVLDINAVPREYFMLNENLINGIRRAAGTKNFNPHQVPGIEFYNEEVLRK